MIKRVKMSQSIGNSSMDLMLIKLSGPIQMDLKCKKEE
jgi:hypothetical protein